MNHILKCLFIIIGTLIGAGFASGQEILAFFNRYGEKGLCGMILSGLLFGVVIFITLYIIDKKNIKKYDELILNNKILKCTFEVFLFICFCIMVAGCGAFFEQQFNLSYLIGSIICSLMCYLIFLCKYKGLEVINTLLVPIIIIGVFVLGAGEYKTGMILNENYRVPNSYTSNWLISSVLYTSYNSIILIPILLTFKEYRLNTVKKIFISIFSTIVFLSIGILMYNILNIYYPNILAYELPNLKLASLLGSFQSVFYGIVVVTAIITTAVSSGYAFLEMREKNYNIKSFFMSFIAVLVSKIGFSELVNKAFPLFGYLGVLQIFCIIIVGLKKEKR